MRKIDPRDWGNSNRFAYEGYPFFTSVFNRAAEPAKNKYSVCWNKFIAYYFDGNTIDFMPHGLLTEKWDEILHELLAGDNGFYKELHRIYDLVERAIDDCLATRESGEFRKLDKWWNITQGALSASAGIIFLFDAGFEIFMNDLKENDPEQFAKLSHCLRQGKSSFIKEAENYIFSLSKGEVDIDVIYTKFIKQYGWLQNSYRGVYPIKKEWVQQEIKSSSHRDIIREKKSADIVDEKYNLLVKTASMAIDFRDDKKKLLLIVVELMDKWLGDFCKQNNLRKEELLYLTFDEILEFKDNPEKLVEKASKYFLKEERVGIMTPIGFDDIAKEDFDQIEILNTGTFNKNAVKGTVACSGKITGVAKVVNDPRLDGTKLHEGDILIASMTRPEYLPLMRRASAFVTNEGGISCHAAIVAREMNKPCIIGTKIATKVFKDGDLIEVDAERGIVTKISAKGGEKVDA